MSSRRDEREKRRAEKLARFEASKAAILAKVENNPYPKIAVAVDAGTIPRVAPHLQRQAVAAALTPKTIVSGSNYGSRMTYCLTRKDHENNWSWAEPRAWTADEWANEIRPPLEHFANLTWGEIDAFASGSGHKMHHSHEIADLVAEAQSRWIELDLEQFDTVFRFRMGGTKRAWGYVVQSHFHMVWWDRHHSLYPV